MEVFSVFATLSLVDLMSGPLGKVKGAMADVNGAAASLGTRFGNLALGMAPVAAAAGVMLAVFGMAASKAIAFESAMADVAKVVNFETAAEFKGMSDTIKEMAGRIPMAADGIAAIIAAAGQSGVAKEDLAEFAEQAAKMGVAFDLTGDQAGKMMSDWRAGMSLALPQVYALADAVNYLSNNMNATAPALGEVIQRVGAAAMSCGLAETQVAALGAAFLSAGASPEIAATALKSFTTTLVKGTAMSKNQAAAFASIGMSATQMAKDMQTDAQGTIFKVLQAIADKPKELQMSLLTEMFGQESIGAIAPLLKNMGNLSKAFELVGDTGNYAGSMQAEYDTRSKTTANALQLLSNKLTNLAISVGNIFLPAVGWAATALGVLTDAVRWVVDTPLGQWIIGIAGSIATALVAVTAFSAAMWVFSAVGPMLAKALAPLKVALLGLGWPVLALIAAVSLLYAAYKKNFGGIADTLNRWGRNISLVVRGVIAIFQNLTGSTSEIRGELARDIRAAGLEKLVVSVGKIVFRIKEFFAGIWDGINFSGAVSALTPVMLLVSDMLTGLGDLVSRVFGVEITGAASDAASAGKMLGSVLSWCFEALATVVTNVVRGLDTLVSAVRLVAAVFSGDWATAADMAGRVWENFCASLMAFADLFRIGDWLRAAWTDAENFLAGINLYDSGVKLLETFKEGILSAAASVKDAVCNALAEVRNLLPFSDAKEGPLSTLTLSGTRLMTTIGEGVTAGAGTLFSTVSGALDTVGKGISGWWGGLFADESAQALSGTRLMTTIGEGVTAGAGTLFSAVSGALGSVGTGISDWWGGLFADENVQTPAMRGPQIPEPPSFAPENEDAGGGKASYQGKGGASAWTLHIGNITLPNVKDAQGFFDDLQDAALEYGDATA